LSATPGNVVDYDYIEAEVRRLREDYEIAEIAFDEWNATSVSTHLAADGFTMVAFRQGFKSMSQPTKDLLTLTLSRKLLHDGHPILRWMMDNAVAEIDAAENIKLSKAKATERIDGCIATVMALARARAVSKPEPAGWIA
jgi:phage terminase large subunit-like protein